MVAELPSSSARLLGRDDEIANVIELFGGSDVRVVTITGVGGVGKTQLALEVARRIGAELRDGAVFVDLAGVNDPTTVPAAVATALDVGRSGADEPAVALQRALAPRQLLLVLDNFEQVLAAGDLPVGLIGACPDLRILITSRAPLRVRAERVFRLAPLPVPIRAQDADVAVLQQVASVELFCERAAAIRFDFQLGADNVEAVAEICRVVDGVPLAIELAAARVNLLSPAVLLERFTGSTASLDALGRGANDLPARQRTMRATIAWSYDRLAPVEQLLLRRLSIFDGDCSLEAIESVCAGDPGNGDDVVDGGALLDALAALVDLHLVEPVTGVAEEARFRMLLAIREFGREQLGADVDALRARHAEYFAGLVEQAATALETRAARAWAARLEHELVEIRAALRHFVDTDDVVTGLRTVISAGRFWLDDGHIPEGRRWLAELLGRVAPETLPPRERAAALMWTAGLASDDHPVLAARGQSTIITQLEEAVALARAVPDEQLELEASSFLIRLHRADEGDLEPRLSWAEACIVRAQQANRWRLAELELATALLAHWAGHHERAAVLATEARALADELGNERLAIEAAVVLRFMTPGTSLDRTAPVIAELVPRAEAMGDKRALAWLYPSAAWQAMQAGGVADAARWFVASLELSRDAGYWLAGALAMIGAQAVANQTGRPDVLARFSGVLTPELPRLRRSMPPAGFRLWQERTAAVREALGEDVFAAAFRDGAGLRWDDAIDEAIAICRTATATDPSDQPLTERSRRQPHRAWDLELTERELDVLRLIAAGRTNKDVAAELGITTKTVMHHSVAIYRKLGVRGRAEATAHAYRTNLIAAS